MPRTRYRFGDFELDPASRELWRHGQRIALPPKSFECLSYLIAHRDRAVGRDELISAVWGRVDASDTLVAQTLLRARKALDDSGDRQAMVRTVPRFGYRWVAPVQVVDDPTEVAAPSPGAGATDVPPPHKPATPVTPPPVVPEPPGAAPPPSVKARRRPWLAASVTITAVLVVVAALVIPRLSRPIANGAAVPVSDRLALVLPVQVAPGDAEASWVRLGAMDYIASRLRRSGLKVVPSDQTLHLDGQLPSGARNEAATWQQLQTDSGAHWILAPEASRDGSGWRVRLRWRERGGERMIEAHGNTPLTAAAAASDNWLHRQGRRSLESTPTPLVERLQRIDAELTAGQLAAVRRLIEEATPAQRQDPRLQVRQAQLAYRSGDIDQAERQFLRLLPTASMTAPEVRASALMGLGAVGIRRRNFVDAQIRYTQALELLQAAPEGLDDPSMLGNAYNGRGVARVEQRQIAAAVEDLGLARIAMQRSGDLVEAAMVGTNLGMIEARRGHLPQAVQEYDRAIAVYERFGVHDYLAAALIAKADAQLDMVQPGAALASAERASREADSAEDAALAVRVSAMLARAQLQNGRLHEARTTLDRLARLGQADGAVLLAEPTVRLLLAQGRVDEALAPARALAISPKANGPGLLVAMQAALRGHDGATVAALRKRLSGLVDADAAIARALADSASNRRDGALLGLADAATHANQDGSPDTRVRLGLAQVRLLLDDGRTQEAAALLGGDLAGYAGSDYRVAWSTLALYRALGEHALGDRAYQQANALRGERTLDVVPTL